MRQAPGPLLRGPEREPGPAGSAVPPRRETQWLRSREGRGAPPSARPLPRSGGGLPPSLLLGSRRRFPPPARLNGRACASPRPNGRRGRARLRAPARRRVVAVSSSASGGAVRCAMAGPGRGLGRSAERLRPRYRRGTAGVRREGRGAARRGREVGGVGGGRGKLCLLARSLRCPLPRASL